MTSDNPTYAQTMDYGDELRDPSRHLRALLAEARTRDRVAAIETDPAAWIAEFTQRDFAIARCAVVLSHRMNKGTLATTTEDFALVERALDWLWRA